jgi:hypothetical protein
MKCMLVREEGHRGTEATEPVPRLSLFPDLVVSTSLPAFCLRHGVGPLLRFECYIRTFLSMLNEILIILGGPRMTKRHTVTSKSRVQAVQSDLLFGPENGDYELLRNVGLSLIYTVS